MYLGLSREGKRDLGCFSTMITILPGLAASCFFDFSMRSWSEQRFLNCRCLSISISKYNHFVYRNCPIEQNQSQINPLQVYKQNIFVKMHNLLESRRSAQGCESPVKLENLSPEKYGKAAYVDLTYTPSKLADNLLFREVTTMKKMEEGNGKVREIEALNSIFQDRLEQIKQERDGIEESLTSQIHMYKRLLQESEIKNESRIKEIQSNFKLEIKKILEEKEEEAKFAQSEQEILEARIEELESIVNNLKDQLDHHGNQYEDLKKDKEKLDIHYANACEKLAKAEDKIARDAQEAKQKYEDLSRKFHNAEAEWKKNLNQAINKKEKEIENIERLHRTELEKIENKRSAENLMKNQQIKDLTAAFEQEAKRLNELVNMKERMIEGVNKDLSRQKQKILELTRSYEKEINDLVHEKNRLLDQIDTLNHDNTTLAIKLKDIENLYDHDKADMTNCIRSLQDEVERNQVNFLREKDRNMYLAGDLEKQICYLRSENSSLLSVASENEVLTREVKNLRELLLESSNEMEKCKDEFLRMGREKEALILRIRELGGENEVLHKIKNDREDEARGWRDSYYISKNRY